MVNKMEVLAEFDLVYTYDININQPANSQINAEINPDIHTNESSENIENIYDGQHHQEHNMDVKEETSFPTIKATEAIEDQKGVLEWTLDLEPYQVIQPVDNFSNILAVEQCLRPSSTTPDEALNVENTVEPTQISKEDQVSATLNLRSLKKDLRTRARLISKSLPPPLKRTLRSTHMKRKELTPTTHITETYHSGKSFRSKEKRGDITGKANSSHENAASGKQTEITPKSLIEKKKVKNDFEQLKKKKESKKTRTPSKVKESHGRELKSKAAKICISEQAVLNTKTGSSRKEGNEKKTPKRSINEKLKEMDKQESIEVNKKSPKLTVTFSKSVGPNNPLKQNLIKKPTRQRKNSETKNDTDRNTKSKKTEDKYGCNYCYDLFDTNKELRQHQKNHSLSCKFCVNQLKYAGLSGLRRHIQTVHSELRPMAANIKTCRECNFGYNTSLAKHLHVCSGKERIFSCTVCNKKFKNFDHLRCHQTYFHRDVTITCSICRLKFADAAALERHRKKFEKSDLKWYICDICQATFCSKNVIESHIVNCHINRVPNTYECDKCGKTFTKTDVLKAHKATHSRLFYCECGRSFFRRFELYTHAAIHKTPRDYKCQQCGEAFWHELMLKEHKKHHLNPDKKPYQCDICKLNFTSKELIKRHMYATHSNEIEEFRCGVCDRTFVFEYYLKRHLEVHAKIPKYSCPVCPLTYRTKKSYLIHVKSHENGTFKPSVDMLSRAKAQSEKKLKNSTKTRSEENKSKSKENPPASAGNQGAFKCETCGDQFEEEFKLVSHVESHDLFEKTCRECGRQFKIFQSFLKHRSGHYTNKHFVCKRCGDRFWHENLLEEHDKRHQTKDFKNYHKKCKLCGDRFLKQGMLQTHKQTIHSQKPPEPQFKCDVCDRRLTTLKELQRHLATHSMTEKFRCDVCNAEFSLKNALKHHMKNHDGTIAICKICNKKCQYTSRYSHIAQHEKENGLHTYKGNLDKYFTIKRV